MSDDIAEINKAPDLFGDNEATFVAFIFFQTKRNRNITEMCGFHQNFNWCTGIRRILSHLFFKFQKNKNKHLLNGFSLIPAPVKSSASLENIPLPARYTKSHIVENKNYQDPFAENVVV